MKLSFYGHSCFGALVNGYNLLFDPFISPNDDARHINIDDIPADFILISHGHEDHIADVEKNRKKNRCKVNFKL
jgi:L-ascorbate metabolism protein UlaG (beta-lactamase superfamily)